MSNKPKLIRDLGRVSYGAQGRKRRMGIYKCPGCHKEWTADTGFINSGRSTQCKACKARSHGMYGTSIYKVWSEVIQRCTNPNNDRYSRYGGRGITVCDEWTTFEGFWAWAQAGYIQGLSIERIENDLGYNPDNCMWIPLAHQAYNKSISVRNTSGYIGVCPADNKWEAQVSYKGKTLFRRRFDTPKEAAIARNEFIVANSLPHKLNIIGET